MRALLTTIGELLGIATFALGCWFYDWRLGVLAIGAGILAVSVASA